MKDWLNKVKELANGASKVASDATNIVKETADTVASKTKDIKETAGNVADNAINTAKDVGDTVANTAKDATDIAINTAKTATDTVAEYTPEPVKKTGSAVGRAVIKTVINGVELVGDAASIAMEIKDTIAGGKVPTADQVVRLAKCGIALSALVSITGLAEDVVQNMLEESDIPVLEDFEDTE